MEKRLFTPDWTRFTIGKIQSNEDGTPTENTVEMSAKNFELLLQSLQRTREHNAVRKLASAIESDLQRLKRLQNSEITFKALNEILTLGIERIQLNTDIEEYYNEQCGITYNEPEDV